MVSSKSRPKAPESGTHSFRLYALDPEDDNVCPIRALVDWVKVYGETNSEAFLFPDIAAGDRPVSGNKGMVRAL